MIQVTSREFREQQAAYFAKADLGEKVVIRRRGKQAYMLTPINDDDLEITPALQRRIDQARKDLADGKTLHFDNLNDINKWMDSL